MPNHSIKITFNFKEKQPHPNAYFIFHFLNEQALQTKVTHHLKTFNAIHLFFENPWKKPRPFPSLCKPSKQVIKILKQKNLPIKKIYINQKKVSSLPQWNPSYTKPCLKWVIFILFMVFLTKGVQSKVSLRNQNKWLQNLEKNNSPSTKKFHPKIDAQNKPNPKKKSIALRNPPFGPHNDKIYPTFYLHPG